MPKHLTSPHNPDIKLIVALQSKSRERKKQGLFCVEGVREIQIALQSGYTLKKVYIQPEIFTFGAIDLPNAEVVELSDELYQKIAYRGSTEGIIALFKTKTHQLIDLKLRENPLILVAEAPEKPGNIGALLRTADAAGLDAVIIANPLTDLYNPNIIRSSVGCVFSNNIAVGTTLEIIEFLKQQNIKILTAALKDDATSYLDQHYAGSTAIVVGTEATGLSQDWLDRADQSIIIPMRGKIDSMNVSVASAILIFEALRQRNMP